MATNFAAREDLVLATEESNSENREGIDGAIHTSSGKSSTEGLEDVGAVMGEAIAGAGCCSFPTRSISWVAEDELSLRQSILCA